MVYADSYGWSPECLIQSAVCAPAVIAEGDTMFQTVTTIVKWVSIPVLLLAAMFSCFAANYEPLMDFVVCLGAIIFVQRAVWLKEYFWAAGLVAIVVVFSPLFLAVKIFLVMGFTCIAALIALFAAFRTQPLPVEIEIL